MRCTKMRVDDGTVGNDTHGLGEQWQGWSWESGQADLECRFGLVWYGLASNSE